MMKLLQLQKYLKKENIDLVALFHPDNNLDYLLQEQFSYAFLFISSNDAQLYISKLDKNVNLPNIKINIVSKGWEKKFAKQKIKKIGINKLSLSVARLEKLKKIFPKAKFVDINDQLLKFRREKTDSEINKLRKACKITTFAFNELIKEFQKRKNTLKTEQQVANFLESKIKQKGANLSFPTIVASGKNSAIPHHQTSTQKLNHGFLLLDFGAKYEGYHADMSRTLFLGTPNKKELNDYNLLLKVQQQAIKQIKVGKKTAELDKLVRQQLGKKSSYFIHSLGHGVGMEIHESPNLGSESKDKLLKKQVFTIEPGIYFPNEYGIRIEDTILLDKKVEIFTKCPKNLILIRKV